MLVLLQAERAWAYAEELKEASGEGALRKQHHRVGRLKKSVKWASDFHTLSKSVCDDVTQLQAEAYEFEKVGLWVAYATSPPVWVRPPRCGKVGFPLPPPPTKCFLPPNPSAWEPIVNAPVFFHTETSRLFHTTFLPIKACQFFCCASNDCQEQCFNPTCQGSPDRLFYARKGGSEGGRSRTQRGGGPPGMCKDAQNP